MCYYLTLVEMTDDKKYTEKMKFLADMLEALVDVKAKELCLRQLCSVHKDEEACKRLEKPLPELNNVYVDLQWAIDDLLKYAIKKDYTPKKG